MKMKLTLSLIIVLLLVCFNLQAADFIDYYDGWEELTPAKITELKAAGCDINGTFRGFSVLMWATLNAKDSRILKDLIAAGANPKAVSEAGETLLIGACFNPSDDIFKYILTLGTDVNAATTNGSTALMFAAKDAVSVSRLDLLVKAGAKVNAADQDGGTALLVACINARWDAVRFLVNAGADINHATMDNTTPLMFAINKGANADFVQWMLEKGADATKANNDGITAYALAQASHQFDGTKALKTLAKAAGVMLEPNTSAAPAATSNKPKDDSSRIDAIARSENELPLPAFKLVKEPAAGKGAVPAVVPAKGSNISPLGSIRISRAEATDRFRLALSGNYLYAVAHRDTLLHVYDISNPAQPKALGAFNLTELMHDIAIFGNYMYIASLAGLYIVDISQPATPKLVHYLAYFGEECFGVCWSVAVADSILYAVTDDGLACWNLANPLKPEELSFNKGQMWGGKLWVNGGWVLVADSYRGVTAFSTHNGPPSQEGKNYDKAEGYEVAMNCWDIFLGTKKGLWQMQMDDQLNIRKKAVLDSLEVFTAVKLTDEYLIAIGDKTGLKIYDVQEWGKMKHTGSYPMKGYGGIAVADRRIYATGGNTIYILDGAKAMPVRPEPDE